MKAETGSDADTWRRRNPDDCIWTRYGDAYVVYHKPSGLTHLLNEASHRLLSDILARPASLASIVAAFGHAGNSAPEEYKASMWSTLRWLEHLGLIERVSATSA